MAELKITDNSKSTKFKFGSRQLFYTTALIAAGLALGTGTIILSAIVLVGWTIVFQLKDRKRGIIWLILVLLFVLCPGGFLAPGIQQIREAARRAMCSNNMRQIMLAITNYESASGHFPTDRIVIKENGTELRHSWRVEILPFFEHQNVYNLYNFDEPWDGPNNSKLESMISWSMFQCPSHDIDNKTTYKLVVGPGTAFESGKFRGYSDIHDGASTTIALIEDTANPVHWMKPGNLTVDQAIAVLNGLDRKNCAHASETAFKRRLIGANLGLLDGSCWCWTPNSEAPISAGAFLISDGILFDRENTGKVLVEIKYGGYTALGIYIALIILPTFFLKN